MICIAIVEIHPNNYMNLMLKTEKPEMNYLNYSNTLWDCFISYSPSQQYIAESGSTALLDNRPWLLSRQNDSPLGFRNYIPASL